MESQPKVGSVFTLLLPVASVSDKCAETDTAAATAERDASEALPRLQARILVADDVPSILTLLEQYLTAAGAEVVTACDGVEALEAVDQAKRIGKPFDLVMLDLNMPRLDGLGALRRLRKSGHRMPVIAVSASVMKGERGRCLHRGFADFLGKPFIAEQVPKRVAGVLAKRTEIVPSVTIEPDVVKTLLLVEDHDSLADLTAQQLTSLGYEVEVAQTALADIDRARALQPAAMVVDLTLPDMDGIELCWTLRQDATLEHCRMIAYTGEEEPERHTQAKASGFYGVLLKPAGVEDFAALLADSEARPE